jgi:alpha/beta superfamily hydrolase
LTSTVPNPAFKETPVWFGPPEQPLLGWLTTPKEASARGGVLLAPPVGREWRAARFAFRELAAMLSELGFVTLRFDYHGVGDSSGSVDDPGLDRLWVDNVAAAASLLRSCGLTSISAVGMRLGATIASVAAVECHLDLSTMVLWDPCESGRAYLRELQALETLRQENHPIAGSKWIETAEFTFAADRAQELRRLSLAELAPGTLAKRVLVITRTDRSVSEQFRDRLEGEDTEWRVSEEQAALINVEPLFARMPERTMREIRGWLDDSPATAHRYDVPETPGSAVLQRTDNELAVRERCVEIGPNRLFGIVAEPIGEARGPLVVLVSASNEDHTGPSRLWVDLSRRWAAWGLRCVRFDLSGLGDSPLVRGRNVERIYEGQWLDDVVSVARTLAPEAPSNAVYVGLCSGVLLSVEAALAMGARGISAINPPDGMAYLRRVTHLRRSSQRSLRVLGDRLNWAALHLAVIVAPSWLLARSILPQRLVDGGLGEVVDRGIDLRVLVSEHELKHGRLAWLRLYVQRRLTARATYATEVVPDLDHGMFSAKGRIEAVARLDRQMREYLAADSAPEPGAQA